MQEETLEFDDGNVIHVTFGKNRTITPEPELSDKFVAETVLRAMDEDTARRFRAAAEQVATDVRNWFASQHVPHECPCGCDLLNGVGAAVIERVPNPSCGRDCMANGGNDPCSAPDCYR